MNPLLSVLIASATLNPIPPVITPCRTVSTPHGDMCAAQVLKVYGEPTTASHKEWLCVRRVSVG